MAGQQVEHVIEEADAGRDRAGPRAVEVDGDRDVGFLGGAFDRCLAHRRCLRAQIRAPCIRGRARPPLRQAVRCGDWPGQRDRIALRPESPPPAARFALRRRECLNQGSGMQSAVHAIPTARRLARHHDPDRPQGRHGRDRRRRPGDDRPDHRQGQRQEGAPARQGRRDRRLCRRDRRRLHAVRAARRQARAVSRPAHARRGRARQGLADRPLSAPARSDDDRRRSPRYRWC